MTVAYLWEKYNCTATPIWDVRQKGTTGSRTYSSLQRAAYVNSSGRSHPNINSSGQFTFSDGSTAVISTSNWSGKYWIANNDSVRLSTNTSSTANYYAVITSCSGGFLSVKAEATIYESYQSGTSYSQGSYIGEVTSSSRSAHPDSGRDSADGYWYVYKGEVTFGKLSASYNGTTLFTLENQHGDIPVVYNNTTITTMTLGSTRILNCAGKVMASDVKVGGKTLSCYKTQMASDISISYTTQ